jgi:hypothetical protein
MPRDMRNETTKVIARDKFGNAFMADASDDLKDTAAIEVGPPLVATGCGPLRLAVQNAILSLSYGESPDRVSRRLVLALKAHDAKRTI